MKLIMRHSHAPHIPPDVVSSLFLLQPNTVDAKHRLSPRVLDLQQHASDVVARIQYIVVHCEHVGILEHRSEAVRLSKLQRIYFPVVAYIAEWGV